MPRSHIAVATSLLALGALVVAACSNKDGDATDPCRPIVNGLVAYSPAFDLLVRDANGRALALGDTATTYAGTDSVMSTGFDTLHLYAGPPAPGTYTVRVKRKFYRDAIVPNVAVANGTCWGPQTKILPVSLQLAAGAPALRSVAIVGVDFLYTPGLQRQLVAQVDADAGISTAVSWSLSDTNVARIDASGLLTAKCTVVPGVVDTVTAVAAADPTLKARAVFSVARQTSCP
jgi:hypothetical protein